METNFSEKEKTSSTHLEPSLGYMGLTIGSMLLSAGVRAASKRFAFGRYMGWVGPAILLYGFYRRFSQQEASRATDGLLH